MTRVILLTYGTMGQSLLDAASHIMSMEIKHVEVISVYDQPDTADKLPTRLQQAIAPSGSNKECLILADLHGCTHFNIARKLVAPLHVALVSGLNLAMLLRVLNHQDESVFTLAQYAEEGGVMGISIVNEAASDSVPENAKL